MIYLNIQKGDGVLMKKIGICIFLVLIISLASGCSNAKEKINDDLKSVDSELSTSMQEKTTEEITTQPTTVSETKNSAADYEIILKISCVKNLAFSKYDVKVFVDSISLGTVEHGTNKDFSTKLSKGEHTIKFEKEDDSSVDGEIGFKVTKNETFMYEISCTKDQIEVKALTQDSQQQSSNSKTSKIESKISDSNSSKSDNDGVKQEYKNALKQAQNYVDIMAISKAGLYDQLTSEYGERFPADAAQYAVDNVKADWEKEALESAKRYYYDMSMSKNEVYDQLVSEYGEKFKSEEAQYAINNLND